MHITLDPAHGGRLAVGGSAPGLGGGVTTGSLDKHRLLDIAHATRSLLEAAGVPVSLTRQGDDNPSLEDRAAVGVRAGTGAFVSLDLGRDPSGRAHGADTWFHVEASPASRALAGLIHQEVSAVSGLAGGIHATRLPLLHPALHRHDTAACAVRLAWPSHPHDDRRLEDPGYRGRLGAAVARAVRRWARPAPTALAAHGWGASDPPALEVHHQVPLVPQQTGMSCWAAAAAMLVGWRDCMDARPEDVANGAGRWSAYRDGLLPADVPTLARHWELLPVQLPQPTTRTLFEALHGWGPLWVGEASPGLHSIVIVGISGDGSPEGTRLRVNDPWPIGQGERYSLSAGELLSGLDRAARMIGGPPQILRTGGRRPVAPPSPPPGPTIGYGTPVALFQRFQERPPRPPESVGPVSTDDTAAAVSIDTGGAVRPGIRIGPGRILTAASGLQAGTLRVGGQPVRRLVAEPDAPLMGLAVLLVDEPANLPCLPAAVLRGLPDHALHAALPTGGCALQVRASFSDQLVLAAPGPGAEALGCGVRDPAGPGGPVVGVLTPDDPDLAGPGPTLAVRRLTPARLRWALDA